MAHLTRDELIRWRDRGSEDDRERIISHLAVCGSCSAAYAELIHVAPAAQTPAYFDPQDFVKRGYAVRRDSTADAWSSVFTSWKVWAGAFSAAVVLLAVLVTRDQPFTTLSGSSGAGSGVRLTVMFQPTTTEDMMRQTLLDIEGTVVSGPSALGVYVVQLSERSDDDREVQDAIDKLRTQTRVIRFVEREP